jgi:hypothetical protein
MTSGGPRITTDNLVLCLDAHDAKSYPGEVGTDVNLNTPVAAVHDYTGTTYSYHNEWTSDATKLTKTYDATIRTPLRDGYGATIISESGNAGYHHLSRMGGSETGNHMISFYFKPITNDITDFKAGMLGDGGNGGCVFNFVAGTVTALGSSSGKVIVFKKLSNGWWFCACDIHGRAGGWVGSVGLSPNTSYTGTAGSKKGYICGLQYSNKSYPTAYGDRSTTDAWKDRKGSNNLTFYGGVNTGVSHHRKGQVIEPKSNAYISFDGTDDYLQSAQGFQIGNTRQKTVEAWVKDWTGGTIVSMTDHNNNYKWQQHARTTSQIMTGSGYGTRYGFPSGYTTSGWHHWVDVCDEDLTATNRVKRYIDGVLISSNSQSTDDGSSFYDGTDLYLHVGAMNYGSGAANFFNGEISVVRIYNVALSQSQAKANFNAQRGRYGV